MPSMAELAGARSSVVPAAAREGGTGEVEAGGCWKRALSSLFLSRRTEVEDEQWICKNLATNAPAATRPVCWLAIPLNGLETSATQG